MNLQPESSSVSQGTMVLREAIQLDGIEYTYPNASKPALKDVSLTIPAKSTVGLVGWTGSGKTTTVD